MENLYHFHTRNAMQFLLNLLFSLAISIVLVECSDPMHMIDQDWWQKFEPVKYEKNKKVDANGDPDVTNDNHYGYSEQSMRDLDEVGSLVGGGDSDLLAILRPYYSMVDMSANGNKQGMGSYLHVLPDEEYGDKPIYTVGGSFFGGLEPAGTKIGNIQRGFG